MSINIDIISGFLGAGKTTFLKKIIPKMKGKITLIENEFGDIGIDGDLIQGELPIKEIYAGCICCSVTHDFKKAIEALASEYRPDHILIEPSGVGSLSDIIRICKKVSENSGLGIKINHLVTIVDARAFADYSENFGGFYIDQIKNAHIILLSHFDRVEQKEIENVISQIRSKNQTAFILKDEWYSYDGEKIIDILNTIKGCKNDFQEKSISIPANRVFRTLSIENPRFFLKEEIDKMLLFLKNKEYGFLLRAKGILKLNTGRFIYFDFTPYNIHWEYIGKCKEAKVVVIGSDLNKEKILEWFH